MNRVQAQLNFFTRNIYFANESIKKVSVSKDGEVFVIKSNNEVALIQNDGTIKDLTALFKSVSSVQYNDIVGVQNSLAFIATQGDYLLRYDNGVVTKLDGSAGVLSPIINSIGLDYRLVPEGGIGIRKPRLLLGSDLGLGYSDTTLRNFFVDYSQRILGSPKAECVIRCATIKNTHYDFKTDINNFGYCFDDKLSFLTTTPTTLYGGMYLSKSESFNDINTALSVSRHIESWQGPMVYWGTNEGLQKRLWTCRFTPPPVSYLEGIKVNKVAELNSFSAFYSPYNTNSNTSVLVGTEKGLYFSNNINKYYVDTFTVAKNYENLQVNHIEIQSRYDIIEYYQSDCDEYVWIATDKGLYKLSYKWNKSEYPELNNIIYAEDESSQVFTNDTIRTCNGTKIMLKTINGSDMVYQWQKDEIDIPNADSCVYVTDQPGKYRVVLGTQCEGTIDVTKEIVIIQEEKPIVTFNYPDTIHICSGQKISLETSYNPNYTFIWIKDGMILSDRQNNKEEFSESGNYSVRVSNCKTGYLQSKNVYIDFDIIKKPILTKDKENYCQDDVAILTATFNSNNNIKWYRNGQLLNYSEKQLNTSVQGTYYVEEANKMGCTNKSDDLLLKFDAYPYLKVNSSNTSLCHGETSELIAETNAAKVQWSTGEKGRVIKVSKAGKYFASAYNDNECKVIDSVEVVIHDKIILNLIQDTTICEYNHRPIVINAPKGFKNYYWNNKLGSDTLTIYKAGSYALKVEDENGCVATGSVLIRKEYCKELNVPNAFSPNGDGVNDLWVIPEIETLENIKVCVFDRYGSIVFQCVGNYSPWNGTHKNKALPIGTYYYIITSRGLSKGISGSLNIIR